MVGCPVVVRLSHVSASVCTRTLPVCKRIQQRHNQQRNLIRLIQIVFFRRVRLADSITQKQVPRRRATTSYAA
jgi:hypothetical protein